MAEKKPDEKDKCEAEVYKLGLELIEAYRKGSYQDSAMVLESIIAIFKITNSYQLEAKS